MLGCMSCVAGRGQGSVRGLLQTAPALALSGHPSWPSSLRPPLPPCVPVVAGDTLLQTIMKKTVLYDKQGKPFVDRGGLGDHKPQWYSLGVSVMLMGVVCGPCWLHAVFAAGSTCGARGTRGHTCQHGVCARMQQASLSPSQTASLALTSPASSPCNHLPFAECCSLRCAGDAGQGGEV